MAKLKHGYCGTRIYEIYTSMIKRCNNQNCHAYKYYGGRGIDVCKEWNGFPIVFIEWAIKNGYSDDLTIDRIDNNKDYSPENCRWVSMSTQRFNQRIKSDNKTGFVGVHWSNTYDKWRSRVDYKGKTIFSKYFSNIKDAVEARNNFIKNNNLPHQINDI